MDDDTTPLGAAKRIAAEMKRERDFQSSETARLVRRLYELPDGPSDARERDFDSGMF